MCSFCVDVIGVVSEWLVHCTCKLPYNPRIFHPGYICSSKAALHSVAWTGHTLFEARSSLTNLYSLLTTGHDTALLKETLHSWCNFMQENVANYLYVAGTTSWIWGRVN